MCFSKFEASLSVQSKDMRTTYVTHTQNFRVVYTIVKRKLYRTSQSDPDALALASRFGRLLPSPPPVVDERYHEGALRGPAWPGLQADLRPPGEAPVEASHEGRPRRPPQGPHRGQVPGGERALAGRAPARSGPCEPPTADPPNRVPLKQGADEPAEEARDPRAERQTAPDIQPAAAEEVILFLKGLCVHSNESLALWASFRQICQWW